MSEWQPIETAPKDRTPIDVWGDYGRVCDVSWRDAPSHDERGAGWRDTDGTFLGPPFLATPTHWMPLPDPPPLTDPTP